MMCHMCTRLRFHVRTARIQTASPFLARRKAFCFRVVEATSSRDSAGLVKCERGGRSSVTYTSRTFHRSRWWTTVAPNAGAAHDIALMKKAPCLKRVMLRTKRNRAPCLLLRSFGWGAHYTDLYTLLTGSCLTALASVCN